ncbi:MAG: prepilin-type N-terminal cleavage/methylation domain-containing protein [Kiritimatiellales bacterium]|jgi:prepilin-type N-terminal cleavage/methylation domain-containing protein
MKTNLFSSKQPRGMTLVEVMLSVAILGILAVLAVTSLFYPRYLVVTGALEQNAIHAGSAEIERHLHNYGAPAAPGQFSLAEWNIAGTDITAVTNIITEPVYDDCRYVHIKTTVTYRDGKTVELETYRSLEVLSSAR